MITSIFSAKWVPWYIALGALPHFFLAIKSGHLIGRWGALKTVIWTDLLRGLLFLIAAALVPLVGHGQNLLLLLMISALVSNIAGALFNPAILTLPVLIMVPGENRNKLTALIDSCFSWGNVLGPLAAALSYALIGLAGLLAINGLSYVLSAWLAWQIQLPDSNLQPNSMELPDHQLLAGSTDQADSTDQAGSADRPALAEPRSTEVSAEPVHQQSLFSKTDANTTAGAMSASGEIQKVPAARSLAELLRSQPVIAGMLFTFLFMNFFLAPLMIFLPWYAKNVYGSGISALAQLELFLGIGTVLGGLMLSIISLPGSTCFKVSSSLFLMAVFYLAFTSSTQLWIGSLSVMALGFFLSLANVICLTFFQNTPESQDVPVVMGLVNLISVASLPVSMGVVGAFIERVEVRGFASICALLVIAIALLIPLIPGIRRVP